ncbi:hypothetical protein CGMCC3_g16430 [Colletotrichum fructicola]|nr:uncharacterized protein CGMCC3_g16430 [Colletotrichum fructicola]KAE9567430.1 hypothetical protein CGMCC3_g16430 [Colletotrichum fructicola]
MDGYLIEQLSLLGESTTTARPTDARSNGASTRNLHRPAGPPEHDHEFGFSKLHIRRVGQPHRHNAPEVQDRGTRTS